MKKHVAFTWIVILTVSLWAQEQKSEAPPGANTSPQVKPDVPMSSQAAAASPAAVSAPPDVLPPTGFNERTPRYQLAAGDTFELEFPFSPEFNQAGVVVQPDGFATLNGVGDVQVSGLTIPEVTRTLQQAYSKILAEPEIVVKLRDFNKPYFVAGGQVGRPGKYELRAATTVSEAVAIAGGFTPQSKHSDVWVFHRLPDGKVQSKRIDVKQMLAKGNLNEDIRLQPGDTVYVPQNTWSKVKGIVVPNTSVGTTITPRP